MSEGSQRPQRILGAIAFAMAALAVVFLALNLMAVAVILNVPLVRLIVGGVAATLFVLDLLRKRLPHSAAARRRRALGLAVALASGSVAAYLSFFSFAWVAVYLPL